MGLEQGQGFAAVAGDSGIETGLLQGLTGQQRERRIIVNDQHAASRVAFELHAGFYLWEGRHRGVRLSEPLDPRSTSRLRALRAVTGGGAEIRDQERSPAYVSSRCLSMLPNFLCTLSD